MKKITLKSKLAGGICLAAVLASSTAFAHDIAGTLTNGLLSGAGNGAVDSYRVSCFQDATAPSQLPTDHLYLQVRDDSLAGGAVTAIATIYNNTLGYSQSVSTTDLIAGDGVASTVRVLKVLPAAQNPTFEIFVHHTAAALDNYLLTAHCEDVNNVHTGTVDPIQPLQNQ